MHQVLFAACGIYSCGMWSLGCSMWDLVPWLGIESGPPTLGAWSLSHWTMRKFLCILLSYLVQGPVSSCWCCSVVQSCLTLCDPMDCSMPGLPVSHHLPDFAQVYVHCIGDAIQLSHPLMPSSPSVFNLSQHQGFSNESSVNIRWPKYWSFSFSFSPSSEYSGLIALKIGWFDLAVQGTFRSLLSSV